jgi:hypothetical protein
MVPSSQISFRREGRPVSVTPYRGRLLRRLWGASVRAAAARAGKAKTFPSSRPALVQQAANSRANGDLEQAHQILKRQVVFPPRSAAGTERAC